MREETKNWWKQAKEDLDTAEANNKIKKYYAAVFFCQQAAEKPTYQKLPDFLEQIH